MKKFKVVFENANKVKMRDIPESLLSSFRVSTTVSIRDLIGLKVFLKLKNNAFAHDAFMYGYIREVGPGEYTIHQMGVFNYPFAEVDVSRITYNEEWVIEAE